MAAVQFWGKESLLKAFDQVSLEHWALFQGANTMIRKGEGEEDLKEFLEIISNNSEATYTLKMYEDPKNGKIVSSTPADGAFNFRLSEYEAAGRSSGYNNAIVSELNALKKWKEEMEADEDLEDENEPDDLEKISGLLEKPAVIAVINKLLGLDLQPARVGAVPSPGSDNLIDKSVIELKEKDPALGDHLSKLAKMAKEKPNDFKYLLSILDSTP